MENADFQSPLPQDPESGPYLDQIADPSLLRDESTRAYLEPFSLHDPTKLIILGNGLVYIPQEIDIKLSLHHDSLTAGNLWEAKTLELLTRDSYWPRMRRFVNEYVGSCMMRHMFKKQILWLKTSWPFADSIVTMVFG